jgi:hypothetical protein
MCTCQKCGAPEVPSLSPRTTYACGASDYDQRPGTHTGGCARYCMDCLELRQRVAELEAPPVVPIGWAVGRFVWVPSKYEWTKRESPKRSWTFLKLRADGSICYRRSGVPAAVYAALAHAVRTGKRPIHAADKVPCE